MAVFVTHSEEETLRLAEAFAKTLEAGDTVLLGGEMGAGKTVFAKGVARGLGVHSEVTSPTYAYINSYEDGRLPLWHFDCYRVPSEAYARALGFEEYFSAGGVCLVEWSENIATLLPEKVKRVQIRKTESGREIEL